MKKEYILYWNEQPIGKSASYDRLVSNANDCKWYDCYTGSIPGKYTVKSTNSEEILYTI